MSFSKVVKFALVFLLIPLVLTACFSNNSQGKKSLNSAVKNQLSRVNYELSGSFTLTKPTGEDADSTENWQWEGYVHHEPHLLYLDATHENGVQTNNVQLIFNDKKLYTHLPQLNRENEFFALDLSEEDDSQTGITALWSKLGAAADGTDAAFFKQTDDESGISTIEITIEDDQKARWYEALSDALALVPFAQSFDEAERSKLFTEEKPLKEAGRFTVTIDEETKMTQFELVLKAETFSLELKQTFTNAETTNPLDKVQSELPWDTVMEQYDELLAQQKAAEEGIPFDEGIELIHTYDYTGDAVRQSIFDTIKANLQALIDDDKAAFDATFLSESTAKKHEDLWNSERKYRFLQIEDLQFKNLSNTNIRVGVFYEYVDPGAADISESGYTYTLRKNEAGTWKIYSIQ